ncbi:hypothetical protein VE02_06905 [Pseudogymnoascus sp. 03VT05]|nr:hypothetical protein VE02_06905 [Pseudogymnoascus sp. 03VT05]
MSSRSGREIRQLMTRKEGLMKKACDLRRLCLDNANEFRPKDFMTVREAEELEESERERQSTSSKLELLEDGLFVPETCQNLDLESIYEARSSPPFAEQESISAETQPQASLINDVARSLLDLQWGNMAQD